MDRKEMKAIIMTIIRWKFGNYSIINNKIQEV